MLRRMVPRHERPGLKGAAGAFRRAGRAERKSLFRGRRRDLPGRVQQDRSCPVRVLPAGLARGFEDLAFLAGAQSDGDKLAAIIALRNRRPSHLCHEPDFTWHTKA